METSVRGTAGWCCRRWCLSGDFILEARPQNTAARRREVTLLEAPGGHEDICAAAAGPTASPPTARRKAHQEGLCQGPGGRPSLLIRGYLYRLRNCAGIALLPPACPRRLHGVLPVLSRALDLLVKCSRRPGRRVGPAWGCLLPSVCCAEGRAGITRV